MRPASRFTRANAGCRSLVYNQPVSAKTSRPRRLLTVLGYLLAVLFLADGAAIACFSFPGASADPARLYRRVPKMPDLARFPYNLSAAWPYPPVILDFGVDTAVSNKGNGQSVLGYSWKRMNYLSQTTGGNYDPSNLSLGVPSFLSISDTSTLRADIAGLMEGKSYNDPVIIKVLDRHIVRLKSGWHLEIVASEKTFNLYGPDNGQSAERGGDGGPQLAKPFTPKGTPDIVVDLSRRLKWDELPAALSFGPDGNVRILTTNGQVLEVGENGRIVSATRVTAGGQKPDDYWEAVGGIFLGKKLVGARTVLAIKRYLCLILFLFPLVSYLAFAWAKSGRNEAA